MVLYLASSISTNTTKANLKEIGVKSLTELNSIPMFNLRYEGEHLPRVSEKICGGKFGGDCFKFASQHLDMYWEQGASLKDGTWKNEKLEARACTRDEVHTHSSDIDDNLYICGDSDKLQILSNFMVVPSKTFAFRIKPTKDASAE
jgi:hypothetical protein